MNGNTKGAIHWWALTYEHDPIAQMWVNAFPDGMTNEQIGDAIGVTKQRVDQIICRAMKKVRAMPVAEVMRQEAQDAEPVRLRRSRGRLVQTGHIGMEYSGVSRANWGGEDA